MSRGRGVRGNREVSPLFLLGARGELRGARAEAWPEEGGSRGKHGFPRGSEPQASDGHPANASLPAAIVARTRPSRVAPSSHELTERERKTLSVTRQDAFRSSRTRFARAPTTMRGSSRP